MTERKYTVPMSGEKRREQLTNAAVKLAKSGGRVTLSAIAKACDVTSPLVAKYLGSGDKLEKTIRQAAAAKNTKLHDTFRVTKPTKKKPVATKKKVAKKVAPKKKPAIKRLPKPSVVTPPMA